MNIRSLNLKNFRGFEDIDLYFESENLSVIIGENGAGKSTILDAIDKLLSVIDYSLNGNMRKHINQEEVFVDKEDAECQTVFMTPKNNRFIWGLQRKNSINSKPSVKYIYPNKSYFIESLNNDCRKSYEKENVPIYLYFDSNSVSNTDKFIAWYKELVLFESYLAANSNYISYSVKEAVENAIRKFTGISITARVAENFKTIEPIFLKDNVSLKFSHLSDGEKRIIYIIGEIIRYFVVSFKSSVKKLLEFKGIVLIDEIEKHLHPRWQGEIIPELTRIFPNIQFFISTHSPHVISQVSRDNVFIIKDFKIENEVPHTLGRDMNSILFDLFNVIKRPKKYQSKINDIYDLLDQGNLDKAKLKLEKLIIDMGENDIEINRILSQIDLMEG